MWRADALEKTLMLGKIEGRRRQGRQRTRSLDGTTDSMDLSEQTQGDGEGQGSLVCCSPWGHKESDTTEWLNNSRWGPNVCQGLCHTLYFFLSSLLLYADEETKLRVVRLFTWCHTGFPCSFLQPCLPPVAQINSRAQRCTVGGSSIQFSRSAVSDSLQPHELQHAKPPCPSPTPRVYSDSCPSSRWWHPAISSSGVPFSSYPQSLPASGSFPMSQLFAWGGQSTGVSVRGRELCKVTE